MRQSSKKGGKGGTKLLLQMMMMMMMMMMMAFMYTYISQVDIEHGGDCGDFQRVRVWCEGTVRT